MSQFLESKEEVALLLRVLETARKMQSAMNNPDHEDPYTALWDLESAIAKYEKGRREFYRRYMEKMGKWGVGRETDS